MPPVSPPQAYRGFVPPSCFSTPCTPPAWQCPLYPPCPAVSCAHPIPLCFPCPLQCLVTPPSPSPPTLWGSSCYFSPHRAELVSPPSSVSLCPCATPSPNPLFPTFFFFFKSPSPPIEEWAIYSCARAGCKMDAPPFNLCLYPRPEAGGVHTGGVL